MQPDPVLFGFDYLDPLSYLVDLELEGLAAESGFPAIERLPLELRVPPAPMLDPDDPEWTSRWQEATAVAAPSGMALVTPPLVPWTRKAHELVLHARAKGKGAEAHQAVFRAVFRDGRDIGRVDVLVDLARALSLDAMETKAVLDVDRYTHEVTELGARARDAGATRPPVLVSGAKTLQGFHNRDALRTFLLR